jgi:hypothetical protein
MNRTITCLLPLVVSAVVAFGAMAWWAVQGEGAGQVTAGRAAARAGWAAVDGGGIASESRVPPIGW